ARRASRSATACTRRSAGARRASRCVRMTPRGLLDAKKLLVTGVLTDRSIAFSVARRAQEEGAEIVLTSFGRAMRLTQRIAGRLPQPPDVLELDVTSEE